MDTKSVRLAKRSTSKLNIQIASKMNNDHIMKRFETVHTSSSDGYNLSIIDASKEYINDTQ